MVHPQQETQEIQALTFKPKVVEFKGIKLLIRFFRCRFYPLSHFAG
ncbi:hypothetical protein BN341_11660 [Helicobacter heilmannii ASB1.4]|nr:hypothetical protein BN341_11660 [Helicobacter heilmannii ASB1.4]